MYILVDFYSKDAIMYFYLGEYNGTESTLHQYVNQHWHIWFIGLRSNKHIKN
jgi:hypothetical protein